MNISKIIENIFFPRFCVGCNKEGSFLCEDCFFLIEAMEKTYCLCENPKTGVLKCKKCRLQSLDALYFASPLKGVLAKDIFKKYTKEPFLKDLSYPLSGLVLRHFLSLKKAPETENFRIKHLPFKKKKVAGYDINKEIVKKIKEPLHCAKRSHNIIIFSLLYTSKMEKAAKKMKEKGYQKVIGVSVFRK